MYWFYHPCVIIGYYGASFILSFGAQVSFYGIGYNYFEVLSILTFIRILFQRSLGDLQARNHIRSGSITGTSDYSNYTRKSQHHYQKSSCCGGYGPSVAGVFCFSAYVIQKSPSIWMMGIFFTVCYWSATHIEISVEGHETPPGHNCRCGSGLFAVLDFSFIFPRSLQTLELQCCS